LQQLKRQNYRIDPPYPFGFGSSAGVLHEVDGLAGTDGSYFLELSDLDFHSFLPVPHSYSEPEYAIIVRPAVVHLDWSILVDVGSTVVHRRGQHQNRRRSRLGRDTTALSARRCDSFS
jgi:hypothetical protein